MKLKLTGELLEAERLLTTFFKENNINTWIFGGVESADYINNNKFNRVEVIDETGRAYVKYLKEHQKVSFSIQDEGKTIKIFI